MLFSSMDKSSKYTANKYGLNTPPCLTQLMQHETVQKNACPMLFASFVPCTNVSVGAQNTLVPFFELISQIIHCIILDRMLSKDLKKSIWLQFILSFFTQVYCKSESTFKVECSCRCFRCAKCTSNNLSPEKLE